MKNISRIGIAFFVTLLPNIVLGAGVEKVNTFMDNVYIALYALALITATCALMYVGYMIMFKGKAFDEFKNVVIGAILLASAAEIAAYFFS